MGPETVIIKKYGNRRLYDSTHSRYVNLDEVAQMVRDGRDVQVLDAATGEDRTRAVLTQIVVEQAKGDDSVFSVDVLRQMVAATGRATSDAALSYMKTVLDLYQSTYRAVSPMAAAASAAAPPRPASPPASEAQAEVDHLKKRIDELESVVSGIRSRRAASSTRPKKRRRSADQK